MKAKVRIARFPYRSVELPQLNDWITRTILKCKADPRILEIEIRSYDDTPIPMVRNLALREARDGGVDFLLMLDNDNEPDAEPDGKPFWDTSFDFMFRRQRPCIVAAPYCGKPPYENVFGFHLHNHNNDPGGSWSVEQYSREHAITMGGIQDAAAVATGVCLIDMRIIEKLPKPWFKYEYKDDKEQSEKSTTEDVYFSRNIWMAKAGDVFINWDAWAAHWKFGAVRKPRPITKDFIQKEMHEAMAKPDSDERVVEPIPHGIDQPLGQARLREMFLAQQGGNDDMELTGRNELGGPITYRKLPDNSQHWANRPPFTSPNLNDWVADMVAKYGMHEVEEAVSGYGSGKPVLPDTRPAEADLGDDKVYATIGFLTDPTGLKLDSRRRTQDDLCIFECCQENQYRLPDKFEPDDVIIDIGANIGAFAAACLDRGAGLVVCYEPEPDNFEQLRKNLTRPEWRGRWTAHEAAVWACSGIANMTHKGSEMSACHHLGQALGQPSFEVRCRDINEVIEAANIKDGRIRLLKIDAEGSEEALLENVKSLELVQEVIGEIHPGACKVDNIVMRLNELGFDVEIADNKRFNAKLFNFFARKKISNLHSAMSEIDADIARDKPLNDEIKEAAAVLTNSHVQESA